MAYYAFLDDNNIVIDVITGIDETELIDGISPEEWYGNFEGKRCIRTSYTSHGGNKLNRDTGEIIEYGVHFRKNYAGVGYTYDEERDAFIPPKPYNSWVLDEDTCWWNPPVEYPENGSPKGYYWNEEIEDWSELNPEGYYWDDQENKWILIDQEEV